MVPIDEADFLGEAGANTLEFCISNILIADCWSNNEVVNMADLRVVIHGVIGKMGSTVLEAASKESGIQVVGGVDINAPNSIMSLPDGQGEIPVSADIEKVISETTPDVVVDFTNADASMPACLKATSMGVNLVIGTTGLPDSYLDQLNTQSVDNGTGILVAPNFALGAVLLMHISKGLGRYFEYADIVEMHHEAKIDSPSGTAIALANSLKEGKPSSFTKTVPTKETIDGTRGGDISGISIHSIRMPGRIAHHEIILGAQGQTLSLKHDTVGRDSFMPGVILAIREVSKVQGVVVGLENIMGL